MNSTVDHVDSLERRIRVALLHEWDPIGILQFSEALDEYDSYVPDVFNLVSNGASLEKVFSFLWWLETGHMGLQGDLQKTQQFASRLIQIGEGSGGEKGDKGEER